MAYFPFFVDVKGKSGLIVGGGTIAYHKIMRLLPYESDLTVVSPEFNDEILSLNNSDITLTLVKREFNDTDIEGRLFVIAATDDSELNAHIYDICTERGILINVVDDRDRCGFMFPSLVKKGKLSIGISTEGASPRIASVYRQKLEKEIPDTMEELLDYLDSIRPTVKTAIDNEKTRTVVFTQIADWCLENKRVPDSGMLDEIIKKNTSNHE